MRYAGCTADSDSVNLGSYPSSPATENIDPARVSAHEHIGQSGQTAHIRRTRVGTAARFAETALACSIIILANISAALGFLIWLMWSPRTFERNNQHARVCERYDHQRLYLLRDGSGRGRGADRA
jgi:hypothetical protein